jgi:hypothetical protein
MATQCFRTNISPRLGRTLGAFVAAVFLTAIAACTRSVPLPKQASALKRGDSRVRAVELLGPPNDTDADEDDEALRYCRAAPSESDGNADYAVVWLYKGAVTGVTTYQRPLAKLGGSCARGFKPVHWEDAPDRVKTGTNFAKLKASVIELIS